MTKTKLKVYYLPAQICQKLGWRGANGMYDVLPLVLQANGEDPAWYEIPRELIVEVELKHPK